MAGQQQIPEYLTLPPQYYPSDDDLPNTVQPALDSLFTEMSRRNRSLSPPSRSSSPRLPFPRIHRDVTVNTQPTPDLRALEYTAEYDPHLMCPICHVPFLEPVVLDCDHTFCASCFDEYQSGVTGSERPRCPSCRTIVLAHPRKASRLISNMCNDIKVQCPNQDCSIIMARGYMTRHVVKDCLEQLINCPDTKCEKQTKRKNVLPGRCIHDTHIECDCGAVIELEREDWLKHKDEICPNTGFKCESCGGHVTAKEYLDDSEAHECGCVTEEPQCPGKEFGCTDQLAPDDLASHISTCSLARLAPYLGRQNRLLNSLTEQLSQAKMRNEVLEAGLDRMNDLLVTQIQPRISHLHVGSSDDVEEIERDYIPGASSVHRTQRDLLLPAHLRDLTPSPTFSQSHASYPQSHHFHSSPTSRSGTSIHSREHMLALHDSLRNSISSLETDLQQLHHNMTELDARTSMQIMNETLRLKEEQAHINAALFSTRAQVQWLLNRERMAAGMNMNMNMHAGMMRGRHLSTDQTSQVSAGQASNQALSNEGIEPSNNEGMESSIGTGSIFQSPNITSNTTNPAFNNNNSSSINTGTSSTRRPSVRRHSGGSQGSLDRVKL